MGLLTAGHDLATDAAPGDRLPLLLQMNLTEFLHPQPGSTFVVARLMELLLVELLRNPSLHEQETDRGLLAGLTDPMIAAALRAMHRNVAHPWEVSDLASRLPLGSNR